MCRSMVDIRSTAAEIRRGKKEERNYRAKIYMVSLLHRATINKVFPKYTDNILLIYVCMYVYVCMYMYDCMNILLKYILVGQVPTKRKQWFT